MFNLRLTASLGSMTERVSSSGRGVAAGKDILEEHTKRRPKQRDKREGRRVRGGKLRETARLEKGRGGEPVEWKT